MVVAVAVAPAAWRNWAGIRLALGRIYSDFRDYPQIVTFINSNGEDTAASIQQMLESTMSRASLQKPIERPWPVTRSPTYVFGFGLPIDEVFSFPAMGDDGMPTGGARRTLLPTAPIR